MMPAVPARVDLVTAVEPDPGVPSTTRARLKAAAFGVVGALLVPLPAAAAPAPCEQPLRYAAQSGAQLMRIADLNLGPAGRDDEPIKDLGLGEVKSALVAQSQVNAAALGRLLDGGPANRKALTEVVRQTAPPNHQEPEQRKHRATEAGPFRLGKSELTMQARWDARMGCGNVTGEATRAETELRRAGVLEDGDESLVRVPGKISGLSTTAMERRGPAARAVAAASMAGGKVELLGGAIKIKIVKPPSLLATMSGTDGAEVRYQPAVLEVSGEGFESARLDTAGDNVELRLDEDGKPDPGEDGNPARQDSNRATQDGDPAGADSDPASGQDGDPARADSDPASGQGGAVGQGGGAGAGEQGGGEGGGGTSGAGDAGASNDNVRKPGALTGNSDKDDAGSGDGKSEGGLFGRLPKIGALGSAGPVPMPSIPGVPPLVTPPDTEDTPVAGPGTTVRISLGDVRQAVFGHAVAAKATAMTITIAKGTDPQSGADKSSGLLDLDMGLLEVAAVAPEPAGGVSGAVDGQGGGGLPITGPRVDVMALTGLALLIGGAAALIFGMRGRSRP